MLISKCFAKDLFKGKTVFVTGGQRQHLVGVEAGGSWRGRSGSPSPVSR